MFKKLRRLFRQTNVVKVMMMMIMTMMILIIFTYSYSFFKEINLVMSDVFLNEIGNYGLY